MNDLIMASDARQMYAVRKNVEYNADSAYADVYTKMHWFTGRCVKAIMKRIKQFALDGRPFVVVRFLSDTIISCRYIEKKKPNYYCSQDVDIYINLKNIMLGFPHFYKFENLTEQQVYLKQLMQYLYDYFTELGYNCSRDERYGDSGKLVISWKPQNDYQAEGIEYLNLQCNNQQNELNSIEQVVC